jgi:hypothetical protein
MLKRFATAVLGLCAMVLSALPATAQMGTPLSAAAAKAGLSYAWVPAEGAATLTALGLAIVVRPGQRLYEVNDRVEVTDRAPIANGKGEVFVSAALARRIESLAQGRRMDAADRSVAQIVVGQVSSSGPITISMRPVPGRDAIAVDGNASSNAAVTVAVVATFSRDVPDVTVNRLTVRADGNGHFYTIVPLAGDYVQGTPIRITAYSAGAASATLSAIIGPPNPDMYSRFDRLPPDRP